MTRAFGEIAPGEQIPRLSVVVTRGDLVRYAGAADDYVPQHWDRPFMIESGFPDVIVHGWLTFAHMCRSVEIWLPPERARMAQFSVRYLEPTFPGPIECGGVVVSRDSESIDLALYASEANGNRTTTATTRMVPAG